MDNQSKKVIGIFLRYFFILILGAGNLYIFYRILTPLTVFSVSRAISLFTKVIVVGNFIYLEDFTVELIRACVAGSAFFLMFILVFSTTDIKPKKRAFTLITSLVLLFLFNFLRIIFLIFIYSPSSNYFSAIHWVLWNFVSVFFVVGIWFFVVWLYKINSIPVYSDIKYLLSFSKKRKLKKRKKFKRGKKHK